MVTKVRGRLSDRSRPAVRGRLRREVGSGTGEESSSSSSSSSSSESSSESSSDSSSESSSESHSSSSSDPSDSSSDPSDSSSDPSDSSSDPSDSSSSGFTIDCDNPPWLDPDVSIGISVTGNDPGGSCDGCEGVTLQSGPFAEVQDSSSSNYVYGGEFNAVGGECSSSWAVGIHCRPGGKFLISFIWYSPVNDGGLVVEWGLFEKDEEVGTLSTVGATFYDDVIFTLEDNGSPGCAAAFDFDVEISIS